MEHRHSGRGRGMTIGRPCVEREQGSQHTEADEDEGEEGILNGHRNGVRRLGDGVDVHGEHAAVDAVEVVDAEDAKDEQGRAAHQHQGQLHGRILLAARAPHANEQVHGDEGYLIEHKHGEHVGADEEAEHTRRQQGEPEEVFLGEGLQLPRGEGAREDDDARQEQHNHGDAVYAHSILDVERLEPVDSSGEQHLSVVACSALLNEVDGQPDGERQQAAGSRDHHATHLIEILGKPQSQKHQGGY